MGKRKNALGHPFFARTSEEEAILILESSPKTARHWRAVFGLQSGEFAPEGRELSALKLIPRIAGEEGLKEALKMKNAILPLCNP